MKIRSIIGRVGIAAALGVGAMAGATGTASAAPPADGAITVAFDCTSVDVASSSKDLSNVVLRFDDGDQKFENLRGTSGTFSGTGAFEGEAVTAAFVKAGSNASGEGPGYGERFDAPADSCAAPASNPAPAEDSEPDPAPAADPQPADQGDSGSTAVVDAEFNCDNTSVEVTSTKDLSNVVLRLSNGEDVKFDGLTGTSGSFDAPSGTTIEVVFVKSGNNASGSGPGYGEAVEAPAGSCEPAPADSPPVDTSADTPADTTPGPAATTESEVAASGQDRADRGAATRSAEFARGAEVLGLRLTAETPAPAATLAYTGPGTGLGLMPLLLAAFALLTGGTVLLRANRRFAG